MNIGLYAVTDRGYLRENEDFFETVETLIKSGVSMVQLREKNAEDKLIIEEGLKLKEICNRYGVPLIINDRADLAKLIGADGVHVGQDDMDVKKAREILGKDAIIGASAHNVEEALKAQEAGADYLGSGDVFGSKTKNGVKPLELSELKAICESVSIPVCAIGGVSLEKAPRLKGLGLKGLAVISGLFEPEDKALAVKEYMKIINEL